jgi:hypothetical protein
VTAVLTALVLAITGVGLDLPPEIDTTAVATEVAVRVEVPPPAPVEDVAAPPPPAAPAGYSSDSYNGRCVGAEDLLRHYSPGWSIERMSRIMYRESRCRAEVRNSSSSATGLLQILASHCPWLAGQMGTTCSRDRLNDPHFNVRAAAVLWREQGYSAWAL